MEENIRHDMNKCGLGRGKMPKKGEDGGAGLEILFFLVANFCYQVQDQVANCDSKIVHTFFTQ